LFVEDKCLIFSAFSTLFESAKFHIIGIFAAFSCCDPHITTIDGVLYTFNGEGEYHMIYSPGVFSLQGRFKRAVKSDGTFSDATVFAAFAIQDLAAGNSGTVSLFQKSNRIIKIS